MAEFKQFTEQQPAFKVLKPWWDVLAEYLTVAMLMIGVFGCTLQVRNKTKKGRAKQLGSPYHQDFRKCLLDRVKCEEVGRTVALS